MKMKVLVTGGAGYIGSTICTALIEAGHTPVILDSLIKGREEFIADRIFYKGDINDSTLVEKIFKEHDDIECVIHCAALIVVSESVEQPYEYYRENVQKTINFFKKISELGCRKLIFSSSASIYGESDLLEVDENTNIDGKSPYARTKQIVEMIMKDYCNAYKIKGIALRYFNPIGADPMLRTGSYLEKPENVLGKIIEAAKDDNSVFYITGTNWNTRDGSGLRDYIHVWDLANGHVKAIENMDYAFEMEGMDYGFIPINIGRGDGVTVRELVSQVENVLGRHIRKEEAEAREGDIAGACAKVDKALRLIKWKAELSVEDGIRDALRWESERKNKLAIGEN